MQSVDWSFANDGAFSENRGSAAEPGSDGDAPLCTICLCDIPQERLAVLTTCHHAYCEPCISEWANRSRSCPLCKRTFQARGRALPRLACTLPPASILCGPPLLHPNPS